MKNNNSKNTKKAKKGISKGKVAAIGTGLAAIGAGVYYLASPKAKAHQKKASVVIKKLKKEIMQKAGEAKDLAKPLYHQAIDALSDNYSEQYKMHEKDIKSLARKLKGEWKDATKKAAKKSVNKVKKVVNKSKAK